METKFYIASDKNGDVFVFNELPERREGNLSDELIFWSSNGDEEKIFDHETGYTILGKLMNFPLELIESVNWEDDEPTEIVIDIRKV